MADSKKTETRKGRSAVKPTTIDLKAKDMSAAASKAEAPGKDTTVSAKAAASAPPAKTADAKTGETNGASDKPPETKPSSVAKDAAAKVSEQPKSEQAKSGQPMPSQPQAAQDRAASAATSSASARTSTGGRDDTGKPAIGMMPFALAGGLGAVGAMVVMLAAVWLGLLPMANGSTETLDSLRADLDRRIAAVESEQTSLASSISGGADTGDLEARVAALEDRPAVSADGSVDLGPVEATLAEQQAAIAGIEAMLSDMTGRLDGLADETATLESEIDAAIAGIGEPSGDGGALLANMRERLDAAEGELASLGDAINATAGQGEITELSETVATLRATLDNVSADVAAAASAREALGAQMATLSDQDAALQARADDLAGALDALSTRLDDAETQLGANDPGRTARALAIGRVSEALARGGDLGPSLTALAETLPEGQGLPEALAQAAAQGLATPAAITAAFPEAADAILDASLTEEDAGFAARLLDNARSVIRVRRVGAVEGETPEAIVSRIEASLAAGDLSGAYAEWQSLPEPAQAASSDWGAMISKRMEAQAALDALASDILASLTGDSD